MSAKLKKDTTRENSRLKQHFNKVKLAGKAWRALSFVGKGSDWQPKLPPAAYIEAQRYYSDGGVGDLSVAQYGVGCKIGAKAAEEFIEYLRTYDTSGGRLQHIMMSMLLGASKDDSMVQGQAVGFCVEIEEWLTLAARSIRPVDGGAT